MRRIMAGLLALALTGCGLMSGPPDEAERRAEALRQPPDVLADARPAAGDGSAGADARADADGREAATPERSAVRTLDGQPVLDLGLPLNAAWAVTGRAIDRVGFELLGSDRDRYTHRIRYDGSVASEVENEGDAGLLDSLAFWREKPEGSLQPYEVVVAERGTGARVTVQDDSGNPAAPGAARQVLAVLAEQLKP
jgi:outer membrane protein assembly factor BamC